MSSALAMRAHAPHEGMPPPDLSGPPVSFIEFWPQRYFYAPMLLYWIWLTLEHGGRFTLPTIANPLMQMGGWIGESKASVFDLVGKHAQQFIAPWTAFERTPSATTADALAQALPQASRFASPSPAATAAARFSATAMRW